MIMLPINYRNKGFTLIETIVSVTILAIAIIAPMTLSTQSIKAAREARLGLEATYLASEGVEIIHNMRDNNSAKDGDSDRADWLKTINAGTIVSECAAGCSLDIAQPGSGANVWDFKEGGSNDSAISSCSGNSDCGRVYYNPTTGIYRAINNNTVPGGFVISNFLRIIHATTINARQVHITSTVTYKSAGVSRQVVAEDDIYNWFPEL